MYNIIIIYGSGTRAHVYKELINIRRRDYKCAAKYENICHGHNIITTEYYILRYLEIRYLQ